MEKIWPTPTGPGRTTLRPPSQCSDSTITAPTCLWHFQPGNKATEIVIVAICLSQRWTCPLISTYSPKPTLVHSHKLMLRAGSSQPDIVI